MEENVSAHGLRSKVIRDAVTGEKLTDEHGHWLPTAGRLFIRVKSDLSDPIPSVEDRSRERDLPPLPSAIDTSQPFPEGRLGGKQWTPQWKRYIGRQTTTPIQEERDAADEEYRRWWHTAYGKQRITAGFTQRYGLERGSSIAQLVLAVLDAPDRLADLATEAGHTPGWLARQRSLAYRYGLGSKQSVCK